ncbi:hypothetical protein, partial [Vibrio cholerae]|uniref:hypothetical protein n=1 Tax=Vibrio cholerae TaxID=666 RepID=UPI001E3B3D26
FLKGYSNLSDFIERISLLVRRCSISVSLVFDHDCVFLQVLIALAIFNSEKDKQFFNVLTCEFLFFVI